MFPRTLRIGRTSFPTPSTKGIRASSRHFLAVSPESTGGYAVVVSKKIAKLSTQRHQIKRRILAALKALIKEGQIVPPALVVFPRSSAAALDFKATKLELTELLSKIKK